MAKLSTRDISESPVYTSACKINFPSTGSHLLKTYTKIREMWNEKHVHFDVDVVDADEVTNS